MAISSWSVSSCAVSAAATAFKASSASKSTRTSAESKSSKSKRESAIAAKVDKDQWETTTRTFESLWSWRIRVLILEPKWHPILANEMYWGHIVCNPQTPCKTKLPSFTKKWYFGHSAFCLIHSRVSCFKSWHLSITKPPALPLKPQESQIPLAIFKPKQRTSAALHEIEKCQLMEIFLWACCNITTCHDMLSPVTRRDILHASSSNLLCFDSSWTSNSCFTSMEAFDIFWHSIPHPGACKMITKQDWC